MTVDLANPPIDDPSTKASKKKSKKSKKVDPSTTSVGLYVPLLGLTIHERAYASRFPVFSFSRY